MEGGISRVASVAVAHFSASVLRINVLDKFGRPERLI
jgi:hypothetical protein